ncbi:ArsR/SmtB family transcription factor [Chitinilyticum litopenaei]|uniref:ArsR/SmtB family transcription factor n=1 Tax=Chitinilyticum litopenaei TaxID=1121276 RepID=UPI00042152E1|nr:metalloregulator ArsR/SmtB family transcription factor [Chitinilyticum litopenaei]
MSPEQMALMRTAASQACALLKVLGNEDRLLLLCQMVDGEKCVSDFEALLGIRQPTLSQQLGVLRNEGLVNTRRDGKRIYYSIASAEARQVLELLYGLYCPAMPATITEKDSVHAD